MAIDKGKKMKFRKLKRTFPALLRNFILFFLLFFAPSVFAQSSRIVHKISTLKRENTYLGRDLWFTMCKNADNQTGKFYYLYVTSPNNTSVHIHIPGISDITVPIQAGIVYTQNIDLSAELTSSGVVEDKGIHVWSDNADLTAYLLSRNPGSSDGMLIIPTTGWGTEYVVAGYESLYEGYGSAVYDYPSEFSIVANQNNTICNIIPSSDIRSSFDPNAILHPAGVPFTEILSRGQCVQYMTVRATDNLNYDVTGTVITSNNPVGVIGASQCANVPGDYLYCDHICDMIPPVRTWAKTYQTVPFAGRKGGDTYVVIGTKAGQEIYRNGNNKFCVLSSKYAFYSRPDITEASTWTSTDPFLLIQYINSSTWEAEFGSNVNLVGDPAMVVINSVEQYVPEVIFQTPSITNVFQNFVNFMVSNNAVNGTTLDGKPIASYPFSSSQPVPNSNYTAFKVESMQPGTHKVKSDSGVGVYIYGYGKEDSYAWSGALGLRTFNDPDTLPPTVHTSGDCFDAFVSVSDDYPLPPRSSKISEMKLDSLYNMLYDPDPHYQIGIPSDSTFYSMHVIDSTKEAFLKIETHDYAGNKAIITSTYTPQTALISPAVLNFGSGSVGVTTCKYITITNTGKVPYSWKSLGLLIGKRGFSIDSLGDSSAISIGSSRTVLICFTPKQPAQTSDTLLFSDGCASMKAVVIGNGGQQDYSVTDEDFGCQLVGSLTKKSNVVISNLSRSAITIDQVTVDDPLHFSYDTASTASNRLPIIIQPNEQKPVEFSFVPDAVKQFSSAAHFHSPEIQPVDPNKKSGWRTALLKGCGNLSTAKILRSRDTTSTCGTAIPFTFTVVSTGGAEIRINTVIVEGDSEFKFSAIPFTTPSGTPIDLPVILQPGEEFIAHINFIPVPKSSGTFKANIFAINDRNDTTNIATSTVQAIYREIKISKDSALLPRVPFGSTSINDFVTYCNTADDSVLIESLNPLPGPYSSAFSVSGIMVKGNPRTLPFKLAKDECMNAIIQFDPSKSPDSIQSSYFSISTDACSPLSTTFATAGVDIGIPILSGATLVPTILSCDVKTINVSLKNANVPASPAMKITGISISPDSQNFLPQIPIPTSLPGGGTIEIPILFKPDPQPGLKVYTDSITVTLLDAANRTITLKAPLSASACGMSVQISSIFGVQSATADITNKLILPIDIEFSKNGLSDPVDVLGITKIKLTYQYNTDLLQFRGSSIANAFVGANGWSLDPGSSLDVTNGLLTLVLVNNNPLNDPMTSLGEIHFFPTLAKNGTKATALSLVSNEFLTNSDMLVGNCIDVSLKGTQFSLVYTCGDSILANYLKNGSTPSMIKPANPNPVSGISGSIVSFEYATKHEGVVSLILYDALGRELARIVDNQLHPAGSYEARFDAKGLTNGSYFYRFQLDKNHASSGTLVIDK
jgi:hypothetical protein